jgi:6-phosphogluconolactonase (cycloisomerase 2 family)
MRAFRASLPTTILLELLLLATGCSSSPSSSPGTTSTPPTGGSAQAKFVYVGSALGVLYSYTVSSTGVLTPTSPATTGAGGSGMMVLDPLGKFLFTADNNSGDISSFTINTTTGVPTLVGTVVATVPNNNPNGLASNPAGTFLYLSNTGNGTVSVYAVNRTTGALTLASTTTVPVDTGAQYAQPNGLITDSTGKYLYVSEAGYISAFSINASTGALTQLTSAFPLAAPCYSMVLDPSGTYIYCAYDGGDIYSYTINPTTGALSSYNYVASGTNSTGIALTSNSEYAYAANRSGGISPYTDNASTGILTPMSPAIFGPLGTGTPYAIAIDPGNQLAYVVLQNSGLQLLNIGSGGTLSLSTLITITQPETIAIYP